MTQAPQGPDLAPQSVWSSSTYFFYQVFAHLVAPVMLIVFLFRSRREPLYRKNLLNRFGLGWHRSPGAIWVFAASLGETRAAEPLIEVLIERGHKVALTHSSAAGLAEGQRLAANLPAGALQVGYAPLDLFWCMRLFLARLRPAAGLVLESEIWPAQLIEAHARGIAMIQTNGNLHERSLRHLDHAIGRVRLGLYRYFSVICTKSDRHRQRYLKAGADPKRIQLIGELKFDRKPDAEFVEKAERVRTNWCGSKPTLLIASSVEDEEGELCALVSDLLRRLPETRIIWVPRSPQRFQPVANMTAGICGTSAKRTDVLAMDFTGNVPNDVQVLIGDTIGEMDAYYALADLVFVGATLANHGGHNIIEPLSLGKPVVVGPSLYGITFPAYDAIEQKALFSYPDTATLTDAIHSALSNTKQMQRLRSGTKGFVKLHKGAASRTADIIEGFLQ